MPIWISPTAFRDLAPKLAPFGVKPHADIARGLAVYDAVAGLNTVEPVRVLDLTPEQAVEHTFDRHRRTPYAGGNPGVALHQTAVQDQLLAELQAVVHADMPRMLKELRPTFNAAAQALYLALDAGITAGMTAERVLALEDPRAVDLWRELPEHLAVLRSIANLRIQLSTELSVPPLKDPQAIGAMDYTACFTAPETGVTSGLHGGAFNGADHAWLTLAAGTGRNLRLNDPDDTAAMIHQARYPRAYAA